MRHHAIAFAWRAGCVLVAFFFEWKTAHQNVAMPSAITELKLSEETRGKVE